MKSAFLASTILLSAILPQGAFAKSKELPAPEWIYQTLTETFPEFVEHIGGFSYEIDLSRLTCSSSNSLGAAGATVVVTECMAVHRDGKTITRSAAPLFLSLLNGRAPLDRKSEAGTSYIELKSLNCSVIEPKPSSPDDVSEPRYSCSYK